MNNLFKLFLLLLVVGNLSSCSYLSKRFSSSTPPGTESVPKSQYDELLSKYELLVKERSKTESVEEISAASLVADSEMKNAEKEKMLIDQINETPLDSTVDIFAQSKESIKASINTNEKSDAASVQNVENELLVLTKAKNAASKNEFKKALGMLTEIENSNNQQIKVRAKFQIAELLFAQQEYDLAMQAYEEIIHNYAFSGVAVTTLGRLVACSEKLKLSQKRDHYYSLIHDVFQAE